MSFYILYFNSAFYMLSFLPKKVKIAWEWMSKNKNDLIIVSSFFLIAVISFGLGRLSVLVGGGKESIMVENNSANIIQKAQGDVNILSAPAQNSGDTSKNSVQNAFQYIASKNGKVYHLPRCPGAKRIKEENKIWFSSREEAEALGYAPAKNCDGL